MALEVVPLIFKSLREGHCAVEVLDKLIQSAAKMINRKLLTLEIVRAKVGIVKSASILFCVNKSDKVRPCLYCAVDFYIMNSFLSTEEISEQLSTQGYSLITGIMADAFCNELRAIFSEDERFRKAVVMEEKQYGRGVYKYFDYPLPAVVSECRSQLYTALYPIANEWMPLAKSRKKYPETLEAFTEICHQLGQKKATPLILKYGEGGFNEMHQDLYGEMYFPFQVAVMLSDPIEDYSGGDFLIEEAYRGDQKMLKRIRVQKGDAIVFCTRFRLEQVDERWMKIPVQHGVEKITSGERFTLGLIFHDADK
jgi:hypothetical protein